MKICFVCCEYPPVPHGGIGSFVQTLGRTLVKSGDEVRVIGVYPRRFEFPEREDDHGVQIWRLPQPKGRWGWMAGRYQLYRILADWANQGEIDLIELPDWEGLAAGWPRLKVPLVVRCHGSVTYFGSEMSTKVRPQVAWLESKSFHRAEYCCASSAYTGNKTISLLGERKEPFRVLYSPVTVRPANGHHPRDRNTVAFAGTLTRKKGIVQLVKAWPGVLEKRPDAELHIYGKDAGTDDGQPMRSYLPSLLTEEQAKTLHFHGHIRTEELRAVYERCRLAIFPSYAEAFGLAPFEAMAEGCPVIYSKRYPGPELMVHERDGLLVDPDDVPDMAASILRLLEDDELACRLGARGRQHVLDTYAPEIITEQTRQFYAACLGKFRNGFSKPSR